MQDFSVFISICRFKVALLTHASKFHAQSHNSMSSTALGAAAKAKDINHQPQLIAEEP